MSLPVREIHAKISILIVYDVELIANEYVTREMKKCHRQIV